MECLCRCNGHIPGPILCTWCCRMFHTECVTSTVAVDKTKRRKSLDCHTITCDDHDAEDRLRERYMQTAMYRDGYVVLRKQVDIQAALTARCAALLRRSEPIFNGKGRYGNDFKRRQARIAIAETELPDFGTIFETLGIERAVTTTFQYVALFSEAGCARQTAHADYNIDVDMWAPNNPRVSHGCVVSLTEGTRFDVWRGAHLMIPQYGQELSPAVPRETIELGAGDVVVFRADCIHAGAAYSTDNVRIHCYMDIESMPHTHNRVNLWTKLVEEGCLVDP